MRLNGELTEAYQRFHRTGPEWGEDQLTNHGPKPRRGPRRGARHQVHRHRRRGYERTGDADALAAALRVGALIASRRS
jgi:hypothetical protein